MKSNPDWLDERSHERDSEDSDEVLISASGSRQLISV